MKVILKYCVIHIGMIYLSLIYTKEKICSRITGKKISIGGAALFGTFFLHKILLQPVFFLIYPFIIRWIFPVKKWINYLEIILHFFACQILMGGLGMVLIRYLGYGETYFCMILTYVIFFVLEVQYRQKRQLSSHQCRILIERNGQWIEVEGYVDTGNFLRNPLTGKGVYLLDLKKVYPLLTVEEFPLFKEYENTTFFPWDKQILGLLSGIYPFSFSSLGKKQGNLPAIIANQIIVMSGKSQYLERNGMIGICTKDIFKEHVWDILLPSDIEEKIHQ